MRIHLPLHTLVWFSLLVSPVWIQPVVGSKKAKEDVGGFLSSFFDSLLPADINQALENITQQVLDVDFSELLSNVTIPEEMMGSINVDVLFSGVFGSILSFFGVPGYEQYQGRNDSPFYADPVPYGSECQFCDGAFDKTLNYAGLTCEEWEIFAGFSQGEECSILRGMAVKHCRCNSWENGPDQPPKTCKLCRDEAQQDNLQTLYTFLGADRVLPTLSSNLRCSDILELPAVDGEAETCGKIQRLSEYCGCDIAVPAEDHCALCPKGLLPKNRNKIVLPGSDDWDLTCLQLHNRFATEESSSRIENSCDLTHHQLSIMLGTDVKKHCGCPVDPKPEEAETIYLGGPCDPCESGFMVRPDTMDGIAKQRSSESQLRVTCQGWGEEVQKLASDDPLCAALRTSVMPGCCVPVTVEQETESQQSQTQQTFVVNTSSSWGAMFPKATFSWIVIAYLMQ